MGSDFLHSYFIVLFVRLRCSGGLGVPCRRKGHGSSGGSGVRSGPDHSHHPYLFLPYPGHTLNGHGGSVTVILLVYEVARCTRAGSVASGYGLVAGGQWFGCFMIGCSGHNKC